MACGETEYVGVSAGAGSASVNTCFGFYKKEDSLRVFLLGLDTPSELFFLNNESTGAG